MTWSAFFWTCAEHLKPLASKKPHWLCEKCWSDTRPYLRPQCQISQRQHRPKCTKSCKAPAPAPARKEKPIPEPQDPELCIKQPETRPISQEQLVAEVKGIYAGLVMVEAKCIEVVNNNEGTSTFNSEQFQAAVALPRTLLHEHHDFFLASQHPAASRALRRLATKYAMPARMWRHGIHAFLELFRHRLPASIEHMLNFIYLSKAMMALLEETVPPFEATWVECGADLSWYR